MKLIPEIKYRGFYLYPCKNSSMEEFMIKLYLNKLNQLSIAQNILITNEETSFEEIQSFLNRAILCNYNTLFAIEINNSFSDYQQNIMNSYIEDLLKFKTEEYIEEKKENIDKRKTYYYLNSCIVFIYDDNKKNNLSFLNEMKKYDVLIFEDFNINNEIDEDDNFFQKFGNKDIFPKFVKKNIFSTFDNIKVITSDICGLGKSFKIKKSIKNSNKKYFHFPLGGRLTKSIIFKKLENLLNKIKNDKYYKDIAIHLDLIESNEITILNEFFFSFLITKFYSYNGNIIYIPKDISIYIEIPNCFENYLSKFSLLNIFNIENISYRNMPNFDYPQNIIEIFNRTLGINSNKKIYEFVQHKINMQIFSFHQIDIFIKIYIFQFDQFQKKIKFIIDFKDITEEIIENTVKSTQYCTKGAFSKLLTDSKINGEDYINQLSDIDDNDLKYIKFSVPLIFINLKKMIFKQLYISKDTNQYKSEKYYLERMKVVLNLPNEVENNIDNKKSLISILKEKNNNYIIIYDNFVKMALIIYRIKANIPTIIMGDTGIGKTFLITKLNQLLNNGETTIEAINLHPGITDEILYEIIKKIDEKARTKKDEELWILFDKINTSFSFLLIKEIFINRTYNGNKMSDNIRLIGTCNPYRKIKKGREKYGYKLFGHNNDSDDLIYSVQPLPQSLLYYVFSFGYICEDDDILYIKKMLENCFINEEKELYEKTTEAISCCHRFLRQRFDPSIVSLRDINRFIRCFEFFKDYFKNKNKSENRINNEKNNRLRGIICSIYICYYFRLTDQKIRSNFNYSLQNILLELINEEKLDDNQGFLFDNIKNKEFKDEIISNAEGKLYQFSDFIKIEQNYLINKIEIDKGIAKNSLLKENIFLLFVSLIANIPALLIGKPGSSKNLGVELILKSMKGKDSKNKFLQMFPSIIPIYFQGSESTGPKDIENLFKFTIEKLEYSKKEKQENIFTIVFDRMELSKKYDNNSLKILDNKLEYLCKEKGIRFVGISNQILNPEILNKVLVLCKPNLEESYDDLNYTSQCIVEKICPKMMENEIFKIIVWTYFKYKDTLQTMKKLIAFNEYLKNNKFYNEDNEELNIKENIIFENILLKKEFINLLKKENKIRNNFHDNYDFYNLIKGIANDLAKTLDNDDKEKTSIIIKQIERNFGGINYDFDLDLNLISKHIDDNFLLEDISYFFENMKFNNEKRNRKLNSVFIFKCLYNLECKNKKLINLEINLDKMNDYNIMDCINDNIRDINSRDLLIGIKPSLISIFYQIIISLNPLKEIILSNENPFLDDNRSKEYIFNKILEIHKDGKDDKLIIIDNFKKINPSLFDIYYRKNKIANNEKYVKIGLDNFNERLIKVNNNLKIILLVDEKYMENYDSSFLGRFEKVIFSYEDLLDEELKFISNFIIEEFEIRNHIIQEKNDNLMNLLCEEIQGLVYYYCKIIKKNLNEHDNIDKEQLKEKIADKIYKILPKNIIDILPENNILKRKYNQNKKIYNFKDYIGSEEYKKSKISIIYTFSSISDTIEGLNKRKSFNFSEIKNENDLNNIFDELKSINQYNNNENNNENYFCIHFSRFDSTDVQFTTNFILNNLKEDIYNYILILHFDSLNNNNIYSLLDINSDIYQLFIDDLNDKNLDNNLNEKKEE